MLKKLFLFFLMLVLLNACDFAQQTEIEINKTKTLIQGKTMGTRYHVAIVHHKKIKVDEEILKTNIDNLLLNLNQQVSTYIPNSQISQFNQSQNTDWIKVDTDFFNIVRTAQNISKVSQGAFDISISPLVNLWGFGVEKRDAIPKASQIQESIALIGYQLLELNPDQQTLKKTHSSLKIDLSAIAKGYAVDKVSDLLNARGFPNHLVEIGGELRVSGLSQADKKWRIAVEQPDLTTTIAQQGLEITNRAVATSGDYRNYFVEKGERRSHIIDPKTGYPIKHNLASVTVLHESTILADAYATALMVMGDQKGKIFTEENNLDVLMIIRNEDRFDFWSSSDLFR